MTVTTPRPDQAVFEGDLAQVIGVLGAQAAACDSREQLEQPLHTGHLRVVPGRPGGDPRPQHGATAASPPPSASAGPACTRAPVASGRDSGGGTPGSTLNPRLRGLNREWIADLTGAPEDAELACRRLHTILLRSARKEVWRRRSFLSGPELDDIAHQATADAVICILSKLSDFRGDSQFTTWAHRFVMFEVASKIRDRTRRGPLPSLDLGSETIRGAVSDDPVESAQSHDLASAVARICREDLTKRQRVVFEAIALRGWTAAEVACSIGTTSNAVHQAMFHARRRVRAVLESEGFIESQTRVTGGARAASQEAGAAGSRATDSVCRC